MMMFRSNRFNTYLLVMALALVCGCKTTDSKKQASTFRVHLEVNRDGTDRNKGVPIYRESPVLVNIERSPFLTEAQVTEARVVDTVGGFALRVQLDRRGTWLLEQYTVANHGKRMAIFSQFVTDPKKHVTEGRWLGAPVITQRISDGVLLFTPDATRDEAYSIALGLNNVAKKLQE